MKFQALNDNVIVRPGAVRAQTDQGLHIPEEVRMAAHMVFAEVVSVGPGVTLESGGRCDMDVEVDDVVCFSAGSRKFNMNPDIMIRPSQAGHDLLAIKMHEIISIVQCDGDVERSNILNPEESVFDKSPPPKPKSRGPKLVGAIPIPGGRRNSHP